MSRSHWELITNTDLGALSLSEDLNLQVWDRTQESVLKQISQIILMAVKFINYLD